jgi:hypothetical protein
LDFREEVFENAASAFGLLGMTSGPCKETVCSALPTELNWIYSDIISVTTIPKLVPAEAGTALEAATLVCGK